MDKKEIYEYQNKKVYYAGEEGILFIPGNDISMVRFSNGIRSIKTAELSTKRPLEKQIRKLEKNKPKADDDLTQAEIDEILADHYSTNEAKPAKKTKPAKTYEPVHVQDMLRRTYDTSGIFRKIKNSAKLLAVAAGLLGVLGFGAFALGKKVVSEKSMSANSAPEKCYQILQNASYLEMHEIPLTWGNKYNVIANGEKIGEVDEKVFNWGKRFDLYAGDAGSGRYIGHVQEQVLSFGHKSTVYDEAGKQIGALEEVILKLNLGRLINVYQKGIKVAVSDEKALTWVHAADIYDGNKRAVIGSTNKTIFWDDYDIEINDRSIDKRIILALVAMEDKLEDESSDDDSKHHKSSD